MVFSSMHTYETEKELGEGAKYIFTQTLSEGTGIEMCS